MSVQQKEAAMRSMSEWLAHPDELGKPPARIQHAGEFDLADLHYYLFKFKRSMLDRDWLLGVCGGYRNDELEHCGHVFSEMKKYNPQTATRKAIGMVEVIRDYWEQMDDHSEEGEGESGSKGFVSFVLLETSRWDRDKLCRDLAQWDIAVEKEGGLPLGESTLIWEEGGMLATIGLMLGPMPDKEGPLNVVTEHPWPDAAHAIQSHRAHLLVAVLPQEESLLDAGRLLVKLCDACLQQQNAMGVYTAGAVYEPYFYRKSAAVMQRGEMPFLNWIYFGIQEGEQGSFGYTYGLSTFGKEEIEVVNSSAKGGELRKFLFQVARHILSTDRILQNGEPVDFLEGGRLSVVRSRGILVEGYSLKVTYPPDIDPAQKNGA